MYQNNFFVLILFLFFSRVIFSQEIVYLENPSFEGTPKHSGLPEFWLTCWNSESPPDTQPGSFDVDNQAFDGYTYAGLCTRSNGTYEVLKKELKSLLEKEVCYEWSFYLSQSPKFFSIDKLTLKRENFTNPVNIVIYGSEKMECNDDIDELAIIENVEGLGKWMKYKVLFKSKRTYKSLFISVQPLDRSKPTSGHILIDYFQPLIPIKCEDRKSLVKIESKSELLKEINKKSGIDKIKDLAISSNFDYLIDNNFLEYQLYNDDGKIVYDNLYFNELMNVLDGFEKIKLVIMAKEDKVVLEDRYSISEIRNNSDELKKPSKAFHLTKMKVEGYQMNNYLKSYLNQKKLNPNITRVPFKKKKLKKYADNILYEGKSVIIYLKE